MSIFNLNKSAAKKKAEEKDKSLSVRLKEEHDGEKDVITEKQLDSEGYYAQEPEVTIEKQLDSVREGEAAALPEKRLDDSKSKLYKHRNPSAYEGDINKLEEKRLAGKPVEDEKYELSSETPKKLRWWENKSPDGLKIASKNVKTAQSDEYFKDNPERWKEEFWGEEAEDTSVPGSITPEPTLSAPEEEIDEESTGEMKIAAAKAGENPMPYIYFRLEYDDSFYEGDEDYAKEVAVDTIISTYPNMKDLLTIEDVSAQDGEANIRLIGDEYRSAIQSLSTDVDEIAIASSGFNLDVNISNETGTPTAVGTLTFEPTDDLDIDSLLSDAVDFVNSERPDLKVTVDSFNLDKVTNGILEFASQVNETTTEEIVDDFDVEDVPEEVLPSEEIPPVTALASTHLKKKTIRR